MNILLIFPGFIVAFIVALYWRHKIKLPESRNKVHFYVARHKDGSLWLHVCKPYFSKYSKICYAVGNSSLEFEDFGLNMNDYDNLKWLDDPVEVFVNKET